MTFSPDIIKGEQGAIAMNAVRVTNMSFKVTCYSFSPPRVQLDETGAQQAMTEVVPPARKDAGTYEDTVVFTSEGPHHIICFNGTCRTREKVFAGDYPAWHATKVTDRRRDPVADAAAVRATTSKLG